jgi:MipA family protein
MIKIVLLILLLLQASLNAYAKSATPYAMRAAYGQYTPTPLKDNLVGETNIDNRQTGIFDLALGYKLHQGNIFDFGLSAHYTRFLDRSYQENTNGYAGGVKLAYKLFPWSKYVKTRFGVTEGLSWVERIPYMENRHFTSKKNRRTSKLLNFLEITLDVSLGDIVRVNKLTDTYIGIGVWHRSGVFQKFASFHNTGLGTNYIIGTVEVNF